jgi:hypothetical protein
MYPSNIQKRICDLRSREGIWKMSSIHISSQKRLKPALEPRKFRGHMIHTIEVESQLIKVNLP